MKKLIEDPETSYAKKNLLLKIMKIFFLNLLNQELTG